MTENKRFTYLNYSRDGHIGSFYLNDKPITNKEVYDLLKEQEETIQDLKTRNKRQYDSLTEITDLMMKRDWKGLEKIVEDWEESDRLLQAEWGNYGDNDD